MSLPCPHNDVTVFGPADGPVTRDIDHGTELSKAATLDEDTLEARGLTNLLLDRVLDECMTSALLPNDPSTLSNAMSRIQIQGLAQFKEGLGHSGGSLAQSTHNGDTSGEARVNTGLGPLMDMDDDREGVLQAKRESFLSEAHRIAHPE